MTGDGRDNLEYLDYIWVEELESLCCVRRVDWVTANGCRIFFALRRTAGLQASIGLYR